MPLALALSACGVNMSGEPKTVSEIEIPALPTASPTAPPAPSATPDPDATPAPTALPASEAGPAGIDLTGADWDAGFEVYLRECAGCHGAGDGAGPSLVTMRDSAATRVEGLDAAGYVYQSIVDPGAFVVSGYSNLMPAGYGDSLSAADIANLIRFILEFDTAKMMAAAGGETEASQAGDAAAPTTAPAAEIAQEDTLVVRGRLIQGTAGGAPIPADLPMQLYALDAHGNLAGLYETTSDAGGTFRFTDVVRAPGNVYLIQVRYGDVPQGAQITAIQGDEEELVEDVTVYERTTDTSTIAITWAQMLINYAPIEQFGLEVWLRLELANTGDRIVTTDEKAGANDWFVSATIELPVASFGIQPMQSEGSERYAVEVVDGVPVVKDTWPLRPGQAHTITVAYYLPYEEGAVLDQAFGYPVVDAAVLLPNDTVRLESDQLDEEGVWRYRVSHGGVRVTELQPGEKVDPDKDFTLVKEHTLLKPLGAGERLIFELVGRPTRTINLIASSAPSTDSGTNVLPIILAAAGVAAIALAGVLWWRQRQAVPALPGARMAIADDWQPPDARADKQTLLRAVAALDDAFAAGQIDEETYQARRDLLIERLMPLVEDEDAGS